MADLITPRRGGDQATGECSLRLLRPGDQSSVDVLLSLGWFQWEEHCVVGIGTIKDITAIKRVESELRRAKDEAEHTSRCKSEFLAGVSHEIRTPMNGVLGMTELLMGTRLTEQQRRFTEAIHRSGASLLGIINGLLDFSKIEAGKIALETIVFDLAELVEDVAEICAQHAQAKGLEVVCVFPGDLGPAYRGDSVRLRQVLTNLAGNAVKFTETGEIVIRVERLRGTDGDERLLFEVRDTGIGIPHEAHVRIFEVFGQADGSTTRKYGGTGLGLAIAQQLVGMMGGDLSVVSSPGDGASFRFTLPLAATSASSPDRSALTGIHALLIVDQTTLRDSLARQLRSWSVATECAATSDEAVRCLAHAAARGQDIDVIVVGTRLGVSSDLHLARSFVRQPGASGAEAVLLTPFGDCAGQEAWEAAGARYAITKPVRRSCLYDTLAAASGRSNRATSGQSSPLGPADTDKALPPGNILLVEDNLVNQEVASSMLEILGCRVAIARDGREALRLLEAERFDVVLMDCQMPVMDGFAATAALRRREQEGTAMRVPVIALTANAMEGDRERCLAAGMDDYLSKPIALDRLHGKLAHWMRAGELVGDKEGQSA